MPLDCSANEWNQQGHSGSSIFELSQEFPINFHYSASGIRRACKSAESLFETADRSEIARLGMQGRF